MLRSTVVACAGLILLASVANAAPITFQFTGIVDSTIAFYDPAFIDDPSGATFTGIYTFDDNATDTVAGSSSGGYVGSGVTLSVTNQSFSFASVNIGVNNFVGLDQYLVSFADAITFLSIRLEDAQAGAFSTDALPLLPPALAPFETRFMTFQLSDPGFNALVDFNGTITALECVTGCDQQPPVTPVPEPATVSLLAAGLGVLAARRRARRR
jgi:hypothetical protein